MKTGIVILNYNTFDDTVSCVESIDLYYTDKDNSLIVIVDNASQDGSGQKLFEKYANDNHVAVILSKENYGFSGGNNLGINFLFEKQCQYIFLLNSDIVLNNDAIGAMTAELEKDDSIAFVGPAVFDINGKYVQYARKPLTLKSYLLCKKGLELLFKKAAAKSRRFEYDKNENYKFKGMASGCCFGFRASVAKDNGLLDDNVFLYYEEDILAYTVLKNDMHTMICANASVTHKEGRSTSKISADKLCFIRFYRWTSSFYVLKEYVKVKKPVLRFLYWYNKLTWFVLSVFNKAYKKRRKDFNLRLKMIMKTVSEK